jgi:hypothetical protein
MATGKKKGPKKRKQWEKEGLDGAAITIRKVRRVSKEIGKLGPIPKLVGGIGLLAAGLTYLLFKPGMGPSAGTPLASPRAARPAGAKVTRPVGGARGHRDRAPSAKAKRLGPTRPGTHPAA